jgi:hypothetical protein
LLGEEYFNKCLEIFKLKSKISGTTPIDENKFIELFKKYFEEKENYYAIGCLEQNELISWIAITLKESKNRGKFWVITQLFTTKFTGLFSFNNEEIGLLIKEAFDLAEEKQHYEFYYSVSERIARVYETQISKCKFLTIGRYEKIDLDLIPANTMPAIDLYQKILGYETKPDNIIIKKRILKPEFRRR